MKANNTAHKTSKEATDLVAALTEGTQKQMKDILKEAIESVIDDKKDDDEEEKKDTKKKGDNDSEGAKDDEPNEESYEVEDVPAEEDEEDDKEEESDANEEGEDDDDWSELDDLKVGDNAYDLTQADEETTLKVYNKLGDDDQIVIKKEDDGSYSMKDEETGAEYEITLDGDVADDAIESDSEGEDVDFEISMEDDEPVEDENDIDIDLDVEDDEELGDEDDEETEFELDENLGYTDNYQDKDPIAGLNNDEPADGRTTRSWDAGAPKGTSKPWAGKGNAKPFGQLDEDTTTARQDLYHAHKSHPTNAKITRKGAKVISQNGEYKGNDYEANVTNESIQKIYEKARQVQAVNEKYKQMFEGFKKALTEAAILNRNCGLAIQLLVNESTTKEEKVRILERFDGVKTLKEGTELYNTIKKELNEAKKSAPIMEKKVGANSSMINETIVYQQNNPSMNLWNRMEKLNWK